MKNPFTEHPKTVGETYLSHLKFASYFGVSMVCGGIACLVHALFPFIFQKTASNVLLKMVKNFLQRMPVEERHLKLNHLFQEGE